MKKLTAIALSLFMAISLTPINAEENTGWQKEAVTYYYYENGQKKTGWFKEKNCWYYLDSATGAMKTGWVADNEYWYFLGESGVMQTNTWIESNGNRYFIQGNGIMAADTVKDGYELDSDGKAIPLSESKSELYDPNTDYNGKVIEGNLYINAENKEVELKNVTIKNKLVVYGEKQAEIKVDLIDSTINTLSFQQKNIEITLSGETTVKNVLFEEGGSIKKDKDYKGSIENITIRSAVKQSVEIDVSTKNIEVNNYAGCIIKSKADGEGTVNTLFANVEGIEFGEDLYLLKVIKGKGINDMPKVHKRPVSSSSNSNDSKEEKPDEPEYNPETTVSVTNDLEFMDALGGSKENIYIAPQTHIEIFSIESTLSNKTLIVKGTLDLDNSSLYLNNNATLKVDGGTIKLTGSHIYFNDFTSKLILVENDNEYTIELKNLIKYKMYIYENTLTIGQGTELKDMNVLTKFKSLFNKIKFVEYPYNINLTNLQDMSVTLTNVSGKVELKGSEESPTVTFLKGTNAVFNEAESFSVYYTKSGTIEHVEVKKDTVLLNSLDAKITGINEVELKIADGIADIDVTKSDFYPAANSSNEDKINKIFNADIFKWDSTSNRWIKNK